MNEKTQFYKMQAEKIIDAMKKRKFDGYYCDTKEDATNLALSMIEENSLVSWGGSKTLQEIGLLEQLRLGQYNLLDSDTEDRGKAFEVFMQVSKSDYYLMSANSITMTGELVNIDGLGNRISSLIFGPKQVIVIAGMNKVAPDLDTAMKRARNEAAPINAFRLDRTTPCTKTGKCSDCLSPDTICCNILTTRSSIIPNRIKVILVGETLGF